MAGIGPYDPCPCGSERKAKFCCLAKGRWHGTPSNVHPSSPATGIYIDGCYAKSLLDCSTKLSREHYFSRALLKAVGPKADISGLPWQAGKTNEVRLDALTAKVLCTRHNHALSGLDHAAARFFQTLRTFDAGFHDSISGIRRSLARSNPLCVASMPGSQARVGAQI